MEVTALQQYIDWLSNEFDPDEMQLKAHELLIVEKQQIIEFGSKMQIIKDVDFDGNVTFIYNPETHFNDHYGKAN